MLRLCEKCRANFAVDSERILDMPPGTNMEIVALAVNEMMCFECAEAVYFAQKGYENTSCTLCSKQFWRDPAQGQNICMACAIRTKRFTI